MEEEHATFLLYAETTKINSTLFDHTGSGDTHYAVRLNGSESERIGLARSLAVMTGDTVRAEVFAKYLDPDQNNWTAALHNLMAAIAGGTAPTGTVIEAIPPVGGDGFPFAGLLDGAKAGDTGTRAYLNILLFDEGLGFLDAAYVPVSMAAREDGTNVPHEKLSGEIVVQQPGYVYIYFSNDNDQPLEVFFDDFTVEHVHSAIVQADDYYPFGLTFNSYKRENSVANKFLYNGKEIQEETGWYDYGFRMYDAAVARFNTVDPLAENYSFQAPYAYAANNPVTFIDFLGLGPASTHTDSTGNVLAVYNDGDNGVYRHNNLPDQYAETENGSEDRLNAVDGEYMGETEYWDEFRGHNNQTGSIEDYVNGTIMFGKSWSYNLFSLNLDARKMGLEMTAWESIPGGDFDLKVNRKLAERGPSTGKLLNGKYATARSAGNYLAGFNAATTTNVFGDYVTKEAFMKLAGHLHSFGNSNGAPYYGEIPAAGRMIDSGYKVGLRIRNNELRKKK